MTLAEMRDAIASIPDEFDDREVLFEEEGYLRTWNAITLQWADWTEVPINCVVLGGCAGIAPIVTFWPPTSSPAAKSNTPNQEN